MLFFWLIVALLVAEAGFLLWCVADERPFSGFFSFLLTAMALNWYLGGTILAAVIANPLWIVGGFIAYLAVGIAWSFGKWWFFVRRIRDKYLAAKKRWESNPKEFGRKHGFRAEEFDFEGFRSYYKSHWEHQSIPPLASENKNRILTWTTYWPPSFIWTMIDEPFRKASEFVFEKIKSVYQGISERAFTDIE